ncbi:MAG: hypothetical protein LBT68_02560 [Spirochaetales bacterium]|jgi:hypothetical protein|nr:hypothetical protein [Spirochaetales bacterium]
MIRSVCVCVFSLVIFCAGLHAWDDPHFDIRENSEIRELYADVINAPTSEVVKIPRKIFSQRAQDNRVCVEVRVTDDAFYILFLNEEEDRFPVFSRGSWIIKRDLATGDFVQVKIFFHSDPGSFVRIFPDSGGALSGKSLMDVYLFDRRLQHDVPLGPNFAGLLTLPFAAIVEASRKTVNWTNLISPVDSSAYADIRSMTRALRPRLARLVEVADGAMDKDGRMVFINTLEPQPAGKRAGFNCSGFVKWIADGLYAPLEGKLLDIGELKTKHPEARGSFISRRYEEERDPFFGLDWSRNIALAFAQPRPGEKAAGIESRDVRGLPYWKYMEDIGFPSADLPAILYYLALTEPGTFYIASVNKEFGRNPVLRQHTHVAVLLPVIDEAGRFSCPVMDTTVESDLERFMGRGDFIHLVRVKALPAFDPPALP